MIENDYIAQLEARWPRREDSDEVLLATIPESCSHNLEDARACYQRAIEIDPKFIEAWESLGHFYNAVLDDEIAAQKYFSEAERLKGHREA
jgi:tetratricopeptide (TPR) repeat protein